MTFLFVLAPLPMEVYSFLRNSLTFITTPCLTLSNSLFQDTRTWNSSSHAHQTLTSTGSKGVGHFVLIFLFSLVGCVVLVTFRSDSGESLDQDSQPVGCDSLGVE